jgi:hypothetical protein
LISKELLILRLCYHAHTPLTTIEKGLGKLLLDLSRILLTHVKLPRTYKSRSPRYLSMDSTQHLAVHPNWRRRSQLQRPFSYT